MKKKRGEKKGKIVTDKHEKDGQETTDQCWMKKRKEKRKRKEEKERKETEKRGKRKTKDRMDDRQR